MPQEQWFTPVYAVISVAVTVISTYRTINEAGVARAAIFICSLILCGIISYLDLWTSMYVLLTARSVSGHGHVITVPRTAELILRVCIIHIVPFRMSSM